MDSYFFDNIKDPCIDKTYKKICLVIHAYNNQKKNIVLGHVPKILRVSQDIGSGFATISQNNENVNIRFYLWDSIYAYVKISSNLNPSFYIQPLSELILQLSDLFDSIDKVMRPLNDKSEEYRNRFASYYPHYKEKSRNTEFAYNYKVSEMGKCNDVIRD